MDLFHEIVHNFFHLNDWLKVQAGDLGGWLYLFLFVIIFCETGLVVTPILPGDSLLFALGTFSAREMLNLPLILTILPLAVLCGDNVNYWIGRALGPRIFRGEKVRFLNKKHLDRTHSFFEKYGGKTIVLARFV